jgi:signal transduction histidine kinase
VEILLAVFIGAVGACEVLVPFASREGSGSVPVAVAAVLVGAAGLLWCRRAPLVPVLLLPFVWGVVLLLGPTYLLFYGQMVPLQIAVFMAARFGRGRTPFVAAGVVAATWVTVDLTVSMMSEPSELVFHWVVTTLVWSAGYGLARLERRAHDSTRRAIAAEVNAAEQAMQAVVDERTRIARELHDIVGHAVSSMVVQAGAAEQACDDPTFVEQALGNIRRTGNDALTEMRRLVSMLRTEDDALFAPQPRLEALPALVAAGGPGVRLTVAGEPRPLPSGLDLTVYRIVQEALTNVRRHSGAARCEVTLSYEPGCVRVAVVDDGRGGEVPVGSGGHGLVGMRERAALYGGRLEVGPEPGGGFAVRVTLPLAERVAP